MDAISRCKAAGPELCDVRARDKPITSSYRASRDCRINDTSDRVKSVDKVVENTTGDTVPLALQSLGGTIVLYTNTAPISLFVVVLNILQIPK